MCRGAINRSTPRARGAQPAAPVEQESIKVDFDETALLAELQETLDTAEQADFTEWFADGTSLDIDADLQFLDGFPTGQAQFPNVVAAPTQNAALGQPIDAFQTLPPVVAAPLPHQQPAMPMQMAGPPLTLQQQYTRAILQQHMMAAQLATVQTGITPAAAAPNTAAAPVVSRRGKTAAEVAEQQERIRERRRESAQRSRQRKSAYMKSLEGENHALKLDNERLRRELARLSGRAVPSSHQSQMFSAAGTTSGSSAEVPHAHAHDDHSSDPFGENELCPVVEGYESGGVANEFLLMTM